MTEIGVTSPGGAREVLLTGADYYPFGPAAGWTYGNGRRLDRVHDLDYRPTSISDPAAGGLDFGYSYDPVGNLTALHTADLAEPPRASFDYDPLGRLTAFRDGAAGAAIESYGYDATGNRTSFANAGGSQAYSYPTDSHRLAAVAGVARSYDNAGNTLAIGTAREFVYNATNRMSQAKQGGAVAMHYVYNGKGEQVRRHLGASDTTTVFDEAGRWLGDYDAAGTPLQQAVWLDDYPVGLLVGTSGVNRLHYVQPDHLGTPRAVIDPVRNVGVWNWDLASEAFGNSPPDEDPDGDGTVFGFDMRFPGQRFDAASGFNYNWFRSYDPGVGRYIESDLIGLGGGWSTYAYVLGKPMVAIDPLGLQTVGQTTQDAWCRQNPVACAAIFGTGSGITVLPKPDSLTRPQARYGEECRTCGEVYPQYDECSEMGRYYPYASAAHALLDFPAGSSKRPGVPASGGLCAMKGTHHTVFLRGAYVGSIFSCRCCTNTGGGPVLGEIWGNNVGR
ncbi:RHS repeat-associated core domain-containing protein [Luteimonas sp. RD2P54]|uniref:RHS repeat-associated core domain-containing protein n=1 Tax=Luteimonas endophytica TaxID=3042023 RepID=A0ABT6J685_9GAMM|nr:RHS repeat-associated core domain-containing protein [Luteimonas endophytica]MDH5822345.1 RHS repeat-associated core domain-containing protein [Luteimonas endophytica]